MKILNIALLATASLALPAAGSASAGSPQDIVLAQEGPSPGAPQAYGPPARGGMRDMLTPEQMVIWRHENRAQLQSMSPDQRRDYMRQFRQQLMTMSTGQLQSLRGDLQARWDALPASTQQRIEQHLSEPRGALPQGAPLPGAPPGGSAPPGQD